MTKLGLQAILTIPGEVAYGVTLEVSFYMFGPCERGTYFDQFPSTAMRTHPADAPWLEGLRRFVEGEVPSVGAVETVSSESWDCRPDTKAVAESLSRLQGVAHVASLGDLCTISAGIARALVRTEEDEAGQDGVLLIQPSQIRDGTVLLPSQRTAIRGAVPADAFLEDGDILVASSVPESGLRSGIFHGPQGATYSGQLIRVRPTSDAVTSSYLATYLQSPTGSRFAAAAATGQAGLRQIRLADLAQLPVPILTPEQMAIVCEVRETEEQLKRAVSEIASKRVMIFEASDEAALAADLELLERLGKVTAASTQAIPDLTYQVSNFYPFPIAYGFRLLASETDASKLYVAQLRFAEKLVAFLGSLALALMQPQDREQSGITRSNQLSGNISMGTWLDIARAGCTTIGGYTGHPLARSLSELFTGAGRRESFRTDLDTLVKHRNDFDHERDDRPVSDDDFIRASTELSEIIDRCVERLAFLMDYPIRLVQDFDATDEDTIAMVFHFYRGDHPAHAVETLEVARPLRKGRLYIDTGAPGWVKLSPYLNVMTCPRCKSVETYYIDGVQRRSPSANLKSFERGHSERSNEAFEALAGWPE